MRQYVLLSCFFSFSFVSGQNLELTYSTYVRQKFNEVDAKKYSDRPQGKEQLKANEEPSTEIYKLIISGKESSFSYQDRLVNTQGQIFDIRYPVAGFGTVYHNLNDSLQVKDLGEIYGKNYYSVDSLQKFNWNFSNETKVILGFETRKATLTDNAGGFVIAWYAPKISVSHGPGDYWGLPGLIFELEKNYNDERKRKDFYFAESIKEIKNPKIIKPSKGTKIKESELDKIYEEGRKRQKEMNSQEMDKE